MSRVSEKNDREEIFDLVRKFERKYGKPHNFQPGKTVIPPSGKLIGQEELVAMVDASLDAGLQLGDIIDPSSVIFRNFLVSNTY